MALVVLTDSCNLSCQTCFRPGESQPNRPPWTFTELELCLNELVKAGQSSVFYTGGEPTLWRDGKRSFTELLALSGNFGLSVRFVTNGYVFRDYDNACALLDRYFELTAAPLQVTISIDYWHAGTWVEGRSPALESLLSWLKANPSSSRLEIEVASQWCTDDAYNLPQKDFLRYRESGIKINYLPLTPLGRAHDLGPLAPSLAGNGTDKDGLGSYGELLRQKLGLTEQAWSELPNLELYGPCLAGTTLTLDLDRRYWLCCDRAGDSLGVAAVGSLSPAAIETCMNGNPLVKRFLDNGFGDTLRQSERGEGLLPSDLANVTLEQRHPYGISSRAACGLCRALPGKYFR